MIYTIYDKILVKNEYILRKGWIRLWKKIIWMLKEQEKQLK